LRARGNSNARSTEGISFSLDLTQTPLKPLTIHGRNGVSQKASGLGRASHYYSFTRLKTRGVLKIGGEVLQVEGQSWFDHEFGSNQLARNQIGWDWFALQLNDGRELMLYRMRLRGGGTDPFSSGTLVEKNGKSQSLSLRDFSFQPLTTWKSPTTGATYPARWRVRVPRAKLDLTIQPVIQDQELVTARSTGISYWEGSVRVLDNGRNIGQGYVELTGYDKPFSGTF
jgi:predicted secreted hydrolase